MREVFCAIWQIQTNKLTPATGLAMWSGISGDAKVVGSNPTRVICLWFFFTELCKVPGIEEIAEEEEKSPLASLVKIYCEGWPFFYLGNFCQCLWCCVPDKSFSTRCVFFLGNFWQCPWCWVNYPWHRGAFIFQKVHSFESGVNEAA